MTPLTRPNLSKPTYADAPQLAAQGRGRGRAQRRARQPSHRRLGPDRIGPGHQPESRGGSGVMRTEHNDYICIQSGRYILLACQLQAIHGHCAHGYKQAVDRHSDAIKRTTTPPTRLKCSGGGEPERLRQDNAKKAKDRPRSALPVDVPRIDPTPCKQGTRASRAQRTARAAAVSSRRRRGDSSSGGGGGGSSGGSGSTSSSSRWWW